MKLEQLADRIGAQIVAPGRGASVDIEQVYAGDRISDLLNAAGEHALLISNLPGEHLLRVAELMDVPAICFVASQTPNSDMLRTASAHGTLLMVSRAGLFETCGRVFGCLAEEQRATR